jgi:hypothetical protein
VKDEQRARQIRDRVAEPLAAEIFQELLPDAEGTAAE